MRSGNPVQSQCRYRVVQSNLSVDAVSSFLEPFLPVSFRSVILCVLVFETDPCVCMTHVWQVCV